MNDAKVTVVVDIRKLNRLCDELTPFTDSKDKVNLIKYILAKEHCYDLGNWDHHWVSGYVLSLYDECRRNGGVKIDMPQGVVTIEEIKISKQSAYITCSGHARVLRTDRAISNTTAQVRPGVHRKDEGEGDWSLSSSVGRRLSVSKNRILRILGV